MDKEKFKLKATQSIDDFFAEIDELEAKKNKVKNEMKVEFEENLISLKLKKEDMQRKYDLLMKPSNDKWAETKTAFISASESFKEGFSKITSLIH